MIKVLNGKSKVTGLLLAFFFALAMLGASLVGSGVASAESAGESVNVTTHGTAQEPLPKSMPAGDVAVDEDEKSSGAGDAAGIAPAPDSEIHRGAPPPPEPKPDPPALPTPEAGPAILGETGEDGNLDTTVKDSKVGLVNYRKLASRHPLLKQYKKEVDDYFAELEKKHGPVKTKEEAEKVVADALAHFMVREQEINLEIRKAIGVSAKKVAEKRGLVVVLDKDFVAYGGTDITNELELSTQTEVKAQGDEPKSTIGTVNYFGLFYENAGGTDYLKKCKEVMEKFTEKAEGMTYEERKKYGQKCNEYLFREFRKVHDEIVPSIKETADAHGLSVVFDQNAVIYGATDLTKDLSKEVPATPVLPGSGELKVGYVDQYRLSNEAPQLKAITKRAGEKLYKHVTDPDATLQDIENTSHKEKGVKMILDIAPEAYRATIKESVAFALIQQEKHFDIIMNHMLPVVPMVIVGGVDVTDDAIAKLQ